MFQNISGCSVNGRQAYTVNNQVIQMCCPLRRLDRVHFSVYFISLICDQPQNIPILAKSSNLIAQIIPNFHYPAEPCFSAVCIQGSFSTAGSSLSQFGDKTHISEERQLPIKAAQERCVSLSLSGLRSASRSSRGRYGMFGTLVFADSASRSWR